MNYIFLTKDGKRIHDVYSCNEILKRLESHSIFINKVYSESSIGQTDFSNVEYIFSTWNMPVLSEGEIAKYFPSLKKVFYAAGTTKYFAKPFLNNGISIYSADYANGKAVADYVCGQILLATKGYFQAEYMYKHRCFSKSKELTTRFKGNYRANIGIIGAGKIGKLLIRNLLNYDLNVYVCDLSLSDSEAKIMGCTLANMKEIFQKCDVISNHLPDIPSTYHIIDYSLFKQMKDYSTFINTGRGRQVVEKDLIKALLHNKTLCALLDVTEREPLYLLSPLFLLKNVFLTPHIAGSTGQEVHRMASCMIDAFEDVLSGKESKYKVSMEMIDRMT